MPAVALPLDAFVGWRYDEAHHGADRSSCRVSAPTSHHPHLRRHRSPRQWAETTGVGEEMRIYNSRLSVESGSRGRRGGGEGSSGDEDDTRVGFETIPSQSSEKPRALQVDGHAESGGGGRHRARSNGDISLESKCPASGAGEALAAWVCARARACVSVCVCVNVSECPVSLYPCCFACVCVSVCLHVSVCLRALLTLAFA